MNINKLILLIPTFFLACNNIQTENREKASSNIKKSVTPIVISTPITKPSEILDTFDYSNIKVMPSDFKIAKFEGKVFFSLHERYDRLENTEVGSYLYFIDGKDSKLKRVGNYRYGLVSNNYRTPEVIFEVSPDNKKIAFIEKLDKNSQNLSMNIFYIETGKIEKLGNLPYSKYFKWSKDSNNLIYITYSKPYDGFSTLNSIDINTKENKNLNNKISIGAKMFYSKENIFYFSESTTNTNNQKEPNLYSFTHTIVKINISTKNIEKINISKIMNTNDMFEIIDSNEDYLLIFKGKIITFVEEIILLNLKTLELNKIFEIKYEDDYLKPHLGRVFGLISPNNKEIFFTKESFNANNLYKNTIYSIDIESKKMSLLESDTLGRVDNSYNYFTKDKRFFKSNSQCIDLKPNEPKTEVMKMLGDCTNYIHIK